MQECETSLQELFNELSLWTFRCNMQQILVLSTLQIKEPVFDDISKFHFIIGSYSFKGKFLYLITEAFIIVGSSFLLRFLSVGFKLLSRAFNVHQKGSNLQNVCITQRQFKVSIIETITCLSTTKSTSIRSKLIDDINDSVKVTQLLRHFVPIDLNVSITEITKRPFLWGIFKYGSMIKESHS